MDVLSWDDLLVETKTILHLVYLFQVCCAQRESQTTYSVQVCRESGVLFRLLHTDLHHSVFLWRNRSVRFQWCSSDYLCSRSRRQFGRFTFAENLSRTLLADVSIGLSHVFGESRIDIRWYRRDGQTADRRNRYAHRSVWVEDATDQVKAKTWGTSCVQT